MCARGASQRDPPETGVQSSPYPQGSGSFRKVTSRDAENLSQIFGPARTPLPQNTPPSRQANAVSAMNAIEAATSWRQLLDTFSLVTKLPSNHRHLLTMTQALVNLSGSLTEDTPQLEVDDLQRFARELVRATRLPLEGAYSPVDVATLLQCFCEVGVFPDANWLYASEAALVSGIYRASGAGLLQTATARDFELSERNAMALLTAAGCFKICEHTPRPELVQLLPVSASVMWSFVDEGAGSPSGPGPASGTGALSPDAVMLPTGVEVELGGGGAGADGEVQVQAMSARLLLAVVHAAAAWGMPTEPDWLQALLECSYFGLYETASQLGAAGGKPPDDDGFERITFVAEELSDLVSSLVVMEVDPGQQWIDAFLDASLAVLQRTGASAEPCCSMLTAVAALSRRSGGVKPAPAWLEAVLRCALEDVASVAPDVLCGCLFNVGDLDEPLTPAARGCAVALALHAQILLGEEEENPPPPDQVLAFSPQGLTLLLLGVVRCKLLPEELPGSWISTWGARALALAGQFTPGQIRAALDSAAEAGVQLPVAVVHGLVGAQLLDSSSSSPRERLDAQELAEVLDALLPHPAPLPASWLPALIQLGDARLQELRQEGAAPPPGLELVLCLTLVQAGAKIGGAAPEALGAWLEPLVRQLGAAGGLRELPVLVEVARALSQLGPAAAGIMPQVEVACLPLAHKMTWQSYRLLLIAFSLGGFCPGSRWWGAADASLAAAEPSDSEQEPGAGMGSALLSYCALRTVVGADSLQQAGAEALYRRLRTKCDVLLEEACSRGSDMMSSGMSGSSGSNGSLGVLGADAEEEGEQGGPLRDVVGTVEQLLEGIAASEEALTLERCRALCSFTQQLPGLGGPEMRRLCLDVFNAAGFGVSRQWLDLAAQYAVAALQGDDEPELGPGEILGLMEAQVLSRKLRVGAEAARDPQPSSDDVDAAPRLSEEEAAGAPDLARLLLEEAGRQASSFTPLQVLRLLQHGVAVGAEAALTESPGTLEALLEAAATELPELGAADATALLHVVCRLGAQPPLPWVQHFLGLLLQPVGAASITQQQQQQQQQQQAQLELETISGDSSAMRDLCLALDLWDVELPALMIRLMQQGLPAVAEQDAGVAACVLHFLSSQEQWVPEPDLLRPVMQRLLQALESGAVPPALHAALLDALSEVAAEGDGWLRPEQLAGAVEVSGASLPAYSPDQLCSILESWVALGAELTDAWLERFYACSVPARCSAALLPGLLLAAASAAEWDAPQGGARPRSGSSAAPASWLGGVEAAARASAPSLSSRDAAVLLAGFARHGHRPSSALVHELLDLALARAQEEQQQPADGAGAAVGPEAAGVVGLIAAAYTSLGFSPSPAWTAGAQQVLRPVLLRIQDERTLQSINSALQSSGA